MERFQSENCREDSLRLNIHQSVESHSKSIPRELVLLKRGHKSSQKDKQGEEDRVQEDKQKSSKNNEEERAHTDSTAEGAIMSEDKNTKKATTEGDSCLKGTNSSFKCLSLEQTFAHDDLTKEKEDSSEFPSKNTEFTCVSFQPSQNKKDIKNAKDETPPDSFDTSSTTSLTFGEVSLTLNEIFDSESSQPDELLFDSDSISSYEVETVSDSADEFQEWEVNEKEEGASDLTPKYFNRSEYIEIVEYVEVIDKPEVVEESVKMVPKERTSDLASKDLNKSVWIEEFRAKNDAKVVKNEAWIEESVREVELMTESEWFEESVLLDDSALLDPSVIEGSIWIEESIRAPTLLGQPTWLEDSAEKDPRLSGTSAWIGE